MPLYLVLSEIFRRLRRRKKPYIPIYTPIFGFTPPPPPPKSGGGRKILPAPVKSWRSFHLGNEVYLVKIAFASENLENFSPPAGYFFVQHF